VRDETLDQLAAMDEPVGGTPVDHSASDNEPAQPGLFARLFKAETAPVTWRHTSIIHLTSTSR
jgi:hypothetical protein